MKLQGLFASAAIGGLLVGASGAAMSVDCPLLAEPGTTGNSYMRFL